MLPEVVETDVAVIGAGLSGLAAADAALRAGRQVMVLEKEPRVGGLCASIRRDGFVFDLGGHRFVPQRRQTRAYIAGFFRDKGLLEQPLRSRIYLNRRSFFYPPRTLDFLRTFGFKTAFGCAWEGLRACWDQRVAPQPDASLEDWFAHRFGRRLTGAYFGSYGRKLWGVPLSQVSADAAPPHLRGKNMAMLLRDFFRLGVTREEKIPVGSFLYPAGGIGRIAELMARRIEAKTAKVFLGHAVSRVLCQRQGGFIIETSGPENGKAVFGAKQLIVTAPLTDLIHMLHPQPQPDVLAAAANLRFRGMRFLNLEMDGPAVLPAIGLTVPEEKFVFFRVQEMSQWSSENAPAGKTACVVEVPCQKEDALWKMSDEDLSARVLSDMKRMGFDIAGRVRGRFSVFAEHSYPFYGPDYRDSLETVYESLADREDLVLTGSPGLFRNLSMDEAIEKGAEAADALRYPAKRHSLLRLD